MRAKVIDIWIGGDTQVASLKEGNLEFNKIEPSGQFKMAFTFKTEDGKTHEATIREYPDGIVYIESDIQEGLY